jgi:hypothetical protein
LAGYTAYSGSASQVTAAKSHLFDQLSQFNPSPHSYHLSYIHVVGLPVKTIKKTHGQKSSRKNTPKKNNA